MRGDFPISKPRSDFRCCYYRPSYCFRRGFRTRCQNRHRQTVRRLGCNLASRKSNQEQETRPKTYFSNQSSKHSRNCHRTEPHNRNDRAAADDKPNEKLRHLLKFLDFFVEKNTHAVSRVAYLLRDEGRTSR